MATRSSFMALGRDTQGMLLGIGGVAAFSVTLPATRFIAPYFDPVFIGLGRALVAGLVALVLLRGLRLPSPADLVSLFVTGLGVVVGFPVLASWAMQHVPSAHGGVVLGILPLATALAAAVFAHERPSAGFWLAACTGTALVVGFAVRDGAGGIQLADLALFGAVAAAAMGYAVGARLSRNLGGWQVICWVLVLYLPVTGLAAALTYPQDVASIPATAWGAFVYLALVSQLAGFFLWYKGLALGGISRVGQTQLLQPFFTLLVAAALIGEALNFETWMFAILVVASVALGKRMPVYRPATGTGS